MAAVENRSRLLVVATALFALGLFLSAYSARNAWLAQIGVHLVGEALRPVQLLLRGGSDQASGMWEGYFALRGTYEENVLLKERLEAVEAENSKLRELEPEVVRLRRLVRAIDEHQVQGIAAEVIGYDPSNWVRAITVDKGSLHGISSGVPVVEGDAVVGQVVAVSPHTSRVLLLTDHSSAIDSLVQSSRARGIVHGLGKELGELRYVLHDEQVKVGDRVITSGMDGVFPKGFMIGVVSEVKKNAAGMFQVVRVTPAADIERLESVLLVLEGMTPQEALPFPEGAKERR